MQGHTTVNRLLTGLCLILVLHLAIVGLRSRLDSNEPTPLQTRLMPAYQGEIEHLALQFHRTGSSEILEVYRHLFRALDPTTTVHVLCGDEQDQALFEEAYRQWFPEAGGPELETAIAGEMITSWLRDRLAVLVPSSPGEPTMLLVPAQPQEGSRPRVNDWRNPWRLQQHLGEDFVVQVAPFQFDGGDLIADERHVFVATPLWERNEDRFSAPAALLDVIGRTVDREVLFLGGDGRPVPDHHIGMFLTPLGQGRVAVGSPRLALGALERAGLWQPGSALELEVGGAPLAIDLDPDRLRRFANVAAMLEARGFEVVEVPLLPATGHYVYLSYNNAMLETRDDRLQVYLPTYGVEALDQLAVERWERLGAEVHPLRVDRIFRMGGSVRCLTAPLVRTSG